MNNDPITGLTSEQKRALVKVFNTLPLHVLNPLYNAINSGTTRITELLGSNTDFSPRQRENLEQERMVLRDIATQVGWSIDLLYPGEEE